MPERTVRSHRTARQVSAKRYAPGFASPMVASYHGALGALPGGPVIPSVRGFGAVPRHAGSPALCYLEGSCSRSLQQVVLHMGVLGYTRYDAGRSMNRRCSMRGRPDTQPSMFLKINLEDKVP